MEINKEALLKNIFKGDAHIISPLVGGMMNQSFIVSFENKKYVLYISTDQANEMVDRTLERDNQKIISDLGLTSKNIYFDVEHGIKVNEYIEGDSLNNVDKYDIKKVSKLLKAIHSSKIMSRENYHPFERFANYEKEAMSFNPAINEKYHELINVLMKNKDFLESQKMTLCHNDAQKSNIVKDTNDNYFIIDFEFMANNDPIYDIAGFGNGLVKEGYDCLLEYFDGHPSLEEKKRFYLWRIFISLQWHNVAIVKHYRGEGKTHGFDFLEVADFFLNNALDAYRGLMNL